MNNEDNTGDILLGIKSPFNHLPVPEQPARYPSIISTNNMSNIELNSDDQLTPLQLQQKNLGLLNVINTLPLDGTPIKLTEEELTHMQKIYDQTGNVYYRSSPKSTLTPIQHEIVGEIYRIFSEFGAQSDLLSIVGSWGDTLPENEILEMFKQFKVK